MKRSMRSLFGGIIEKTEDPELILQQTIRDMRDRVPDLNNSVAQVMATEKLLTKSKERLETQVVDLDSKIRASVKMGRDDIATAYIGQLQQAQIDLQKTSQQLEHANLASKQALKARDNYVLQMQRRTAEAMQLINQSKQAKLRNNWRRRWSRLSLAMTHPLSMRCGTKLIVGLLLQKPKCSWVRHQLIPKCRISSARPSICNCKTSCLPTSEIWAFWVQDPRFQLLRHCPPKAKQHRRRAAVTMALALVEANRADVFGKWSVIRISIGLWPSFPNSISGI
jgi:phage shock protein A